MKYVNEELGGIDGHPVSCHVLHVHDRGAGADLRPEDGQRRGVQVVAVGAVAIGGQSLVATIDAQKPMVYSVAVGAVRPDEQERLHPLRDAHPRLGAVRHLREGRAARQDGGRGLPAAAGHRGRLQCDGREGLKAAGVDVKRVSWSPNATDLVGPLTAAGAQTADVIMPNADPQVLREPREDDREPS